MSESMNIFRQIMTGEYWSVIVVIAAIMAYLLVFLLLLLQYMQQKKFNRQILYLKTKLSDYLRVITEDEVERNQQEARTISVQEQNMRSSIKKARDEKDAQLLDAMLAEFF